MTLASTEIKASGSDMLLKFASADRLVDGLPKGQGDILLKP